MKKLLAMVIVLAIALTMVSIPSFAAENVILEETFEDEAAYLAFNGYGWNNTEGSNGYFDAESHTADGSGSLKVVNGASGNTGHFTAVVALEAGKLYTISCWAKNVDVASPNAGISINPPKHTWVGHPVGDFSTGAKIDVANTDWQYISFEFVPTADDLFTVPEGGEAEFGNPEGTTITYVSLFVWGVSGTVYFDEVKVAEKVKATPTETMPVVEGNLLEDDVSALAVAGAAPFGHFWGDAADVVEKIDYDVSHTNDGTGSIYIELPTGGHDCFCILDTALLEAGRTYKVSAWIKTTDKFAPEAGQAGAFISFGDTAPATTIVSEASDWVYVEGTYTVTDADIASYEENTAAAMPGRIAFQARNWGATGGAWFDEIAVVDITDNASTGDATMIAIAVIAVAMAAAVVFSKKRSTAK